MTVDLSDRLAGVVAAVLGISEAQAASASAELVPAWDSIAHLNLVLAVEQEFDVHFSTDEIAELDSVARIREALDQAAENRGAV
jgi:acyl carrier protein